MKYAVIIEESAENLGAYVPDLPGCTAVGDTREEVLCLIQEAIQLHIESLEQQGLEIPPPNSSVEIVDVAA